MDYDQHPSRADPYPYIPFMDYDQHPSCLLLRELRIVRSLVAALMPPVSLVNVIVHSMRQHGVVDLHLEQLVASCRKQGLTLEAEDPAPTPETDDPTNTGVVAAADG